MNELHKVYLNLGSNIKPEINLVQAIKLLSKYGEVHRISRAWESKSVGAAGPNFLNTCALFMSSQTRIELKELVVHPIEAELGRVRSENKFIPRTIDIDIILFDDQPYSDKYWEDAFVIVPLAEIYPEYKNPKTGEFIRETAMRLRQKTWIETRPEVLGQISVGHPKV